MTTRSTYLDAVVAGAVSTGWFLLTTTVLDQVPDAVLLAAAGAIALAVSIAFLGVPRVAQMERTALVRGLLGGAMAFGAAPLLVLSQRASDAPSGSESLFFTTAAWGMLGVVGGFVAERARLSLDGGERRSSFVRIAGAALALAGTAGLLANWERPSSFSPLVKFPVAEGLMLVAGGVFVVGLWLLSETVTEVHPREVSIIALIGAAVVTVAFIPLTGLGDVGPWRWIWPQVVLLGAMGAALAITWPRLLSARGVAGSSALLFLPPLALTALSIAEKASGTYGPDPVLWPAALSGAAITVSGIAIVWVRPRLQSRLPSGRPRATVACAAVATALSLASLATPALLAVSEGVLSDGQRYHVTWAMVGAESAAGWLPLVSALLLLSSILEPSARASRRAVVASVAGVTLAAYWPLAATPLHTWTRWIPADVQQAYGTEYARFAVEPVLDPVRMAALAACAITCILVLVAAGRSLARGADEIRNAREVV